jgi:hypothetical protein
MGNGENDIALDVYIALPIRVYMVKPPLSSCPLSVVNCLQKLCYSVAREIVLLSHSFANSCSSGRLFSQGAV